MKKLSCLLLILSLGMESWASNSDEEFDVPSSDGRFVAEIRAPGVDSRRHWTLTVHDTSEPGRRVELWSTRYQPDAGATSYWLSADGRLFVSLQHLYRQSSPLARILPAGGETVALYASDLGLRYGELARGPDGRVWILPQVEPLDSGWVETLRGPVYGLVLPCSDGVLRVVDVEGGAVLDEDLLPPTEPWVEPSLGAHGPLDSMFVNEVWLPVVAEAGSAAAVQIRGLPPTLAWKLEGFELTQDSPWRLRITPWGQRFISDQGYHPAPQSCEFTVHLHGLAAGRYQLLVNGLDGSEATDEQDLVVLPATASVYLSIYGGPDGIDRDVTVFPQGIVKLDSQRHARPEYRVLPAEDLEEILALVAELPTDSIPHWSDERGPVLSYQLIFRYHDEFAHIGADEMTLLGPTAELVSILSRLFDE